MANRSSERPTPRPLSSGFPSDISRPDLSDFQFKTIGKEPALLQRISAPDSSAHVGYDMELSPISSPDPNEFITSDVSAAETSGTKRPSLRERLSMSDSSGDPDIGMLASRKAEHPSQSSVFSNDLSMRPLGRAEANSQISSAIVRQSAPPHEHTLPSPVSPPPSNFPESSVLSSNGIGAMSNITLPAAVQHRSGDVESSPSHTSAGNEVNIDSLAVLHTSLNTALDNLRALRTSASPCSVQIAKDQCSEVLSAAQRANELAEQALLSAQQSRAAAHQCLSVAESVQSRVTEYVTTVGNLESSQDLVLSAVEDVSKRLQQWVSDRRVYEARFQRQLEGREMELRRQQLRPSVPNLNETAAASPCGSRQRQPMTLVVDASESLDFQPGFLQEAGVVTRAWSQVVEQRAERKRQFEEDQRKRREAEELLEKEKGKAQAELEAREAALARARAERLEAERRERCQEEEESIFALRAQESRSSEAAKEGLTSQSTESQERALQVIRERQQSDSKQKNKDNPSRAETVDEKDTALRDPKNLERLPRRLEAERLSRHADQKVQNTSSKDNQPTSDSLPLQTFTASSVPGLGSQFVPPSLNFTPHSFGNVVSKKTLLAATPTSAKKQSKVISGSVHVSPVSSSAMSRPAPISTSSTPLQSSVATNTIANSTRHLPSHLPLKPTRSPSPTRSAVHNNVVHSRSANISNVTPMPFPQEASSTAGGEFTVSNLSHLSMKTTAQANGLYSNASANAMNPNTCNTMMDQPHAFRVSPDAQKVNLRQLRDVDGAPEIGHIKREAVEEDLVFNPQRKYVTSDLREGNIESVNDKELVRKALKGEPQDEIPLPSPPNPHLSPPTPTAGLSALSSISSGPQPSDHSLQRISRPNDTPEQQAAMLPTYSRGHTSAAIAKTKQSDSFIANPPMHGPALVQTSLPARPPSTSVLPSDNAAEVAHRRSVPVASEESYRIASDTSSTDGRSQTNLLSEKLPLSRPHFGAGPPSMALNYHSVSPSPYPSGHSDDRGRPFRNRPRIRNVDHYSPERSRFSPPLSRSRSGGGNNSRGVSPGQQYKPLRQISPRSPVRPVAHVSSAFAGQKRRRDEQHVAGPSTRRSRFEEHPLSRHPSELSSGPPYASTEHGYQEEWSHTAAYARSPSPRRAPASLAQRIAGDTDARSAFREPRDDPPSRRQVISHPPTRGRGPSPSRPVYRGARNDNRPPLLDRFTDSRTQRVDVWQESPPLEGRITGKNSLINRLM